WRAWLRTPSTTWSASASSSSASTSVGWPGAARSQASTCSRPSQARPPATVFPNDIGGGAPGGPVDVGAAQRVDPVEHELQVGLCLLVVHRLLLLAVRTERVGTSSAAGGARAPPPNRSALGRSHQGDPHAKKKKTFEAAGLDRRAALYRQPGIKPNGKPTPRRCPTPRSTLQTDGLGHTLHGLDAASAPATRAAESGAVCAELLAARPGNRFGRLQ